MKASGSKWFSARQGPTFGIVYGENEETKCRQAFIGQATPRTLRSEDEENIISTGAKVSSQDMLDIFNFLNQKGDDK